MNIGARALTSQGLNVHAGHDDLMSVADCGWGILFGRNAQEAGDLCLIARRAAEACMTPFMNVQDGFLTTHTVESARDRKSTRLNSSHANISYAVFCLTKKNYKEHSLL